MTYDRNTVIAKITALKGRRGADYISNAKIAEYLGVSEKAVKDWLRVSPDNATGDSKRYTDIPLKHIVQLCDLFECDIQYFLDPKMTCKTRVTTDISNATGLSEKAVNLLSEDECRENYLEQTNQENILLKSRRDVVESLILESEITEGGFVQTLMSYLIKSQNTARYQSHPLFNLIAQISNDYRKNTLLMETFMGRPFALNDELEMMCEEIQVALSDLGYSEEEISKIYVETDGFFSDYRELIVGEDLIKADMQVKFVEFVDDNFFEVLRNGKQD